MDLEALSQKGIAALLTLPRSDLHEQRENQSQKSSPQLSADGMSENRHEGEEDTAPLVLLQLPSGWTPENLKASRFVCQGPGAPVSLVCESQETSFAVHSCETSNVLVLVPPPSAASSSKRRKVCEERSAFATTLQQAPARLLRTSGASFLELRPQALDRNALIQALNTFHPMQDVAEAVEREARSTTANQSETEEFSCQGRSVAELSNLLQVSKAEICRALRDVQAYCRHPDSFVLLSDQTTYECNQAVVSALGERHIDYSTEYGLNDVVQFVLDHMSNEERFDSADRVVRFCVLQLSEESATFADDWLDYHPLVDHNIRFSLPKVAACVARHLFLLQTKPWEETLFLSRWQGLVPGDGQVDINLLRGIAIAVSAEEAAIGGPGAGAKTAPTSSTTDEEVFWKYLPVERLPLDAREGITELFRHKPRWRGEELEPYAARYVNSGGTTLDLLLRYTKVVEDVAHSVPVPYYVLR